jgi:hypothetical protein
MAEPHRKSNLVIIMTVLGAVASLVVSEILKGTLGVYIFAVYLAALTIFLMIALTRGVWKVFRPDDPTDLSLKQ